MAEYKDQLDRTRRWLVRIENKNAPPTEHLDFMFAFFQNCWHMKEWIKHDTTLSRSIRDSIETKAAQYDSLMTCADIANRSKHLNLTSVRRKAKLEQHVNIVVNVQADAAKTSSTTTSENSVDVPSKPSQNALDVAKQAIKDWESILSSYGLSIT